ncbi:MAG: transglutaminaseTgpA domain-containing protein [Longimicrobiales bacterium]|nr:transglutaminaseTgpA domain-containing protein [Longimicrobiales bacterium]
MTLETIHRRLVVVMALSALLAFAVGAGFSPLPVILAALALTAAFFRQPRPETVESIERIMVPLALLLAVRVILEATLFRGDVVVPVVDLLLLLLCTEVLRSEDAGNDARLYALTFALILASTAYRPGALFALSFLLFLGLGSVALSVGLLRRKSERFGGPEPVLDRSFAVTSVGITSAILVSAIVVFVAFPRVSRSWSGRGEVFATPIVGFSDRISLGQHGATLRSNPSVVLRVEFPEGPPEPVSDLRWRGRSYDAFDGVEWTRSEPTRPARAPVSWYRQRWPDSVVTQTIHAAPLDVPVVFGLHPLHLVDPQVPISPMMDDVGDWFFWGSNQQPSYTSISGALPPSPDELRAASGAFYPDRTRYLQLPELPERIVHLADSLTAPYDTRYDQVAAVHRFFVSNFGYTRELPATARETSIDHFLFERREGHCEYFSSAMVVLLRAAGIEARNVNGFLGGRWNAFGDFLSVTQNEAHSWVEVWFPGYGWVEWDPTPPGSTAGAAASAWWFPGRQWLDGLTHRWNQWVLEYDLGLQLDLFGRLGALFGDDPAGTTGGGVPRAIWWGLAGGIVLVVVGARAVGPAGRRLRPESRAWRAFARAARRAGLVEDELVTSGVVTPGVLLVRIADARPEALPAARRFAALYEETRFGDREPRGEDRARLRAAFAEAKRALS